MLEDNRYNIQPNLQSHMKYYIFVTGRIMFSVTVGISSNADLMIRIKVRGNLVYNKLSYCVTKLLQCSLRKLDPYVVSAGLLSNSQESHHGDQRESTPAETI